MDPSPTAEFRLGPLLFRHFYEDARQFPIAHAVLEIQRGARGLVYRWRVPNCPCGCGSEHWHGGGRVGVDDPRGFLTHRAGHCVGSVGRGYILADRDPDRTAEIIRRTAA